MEQVLSLGVFLVLVGAACGSGGKLETKDLLQQSKSLQSLAAEGALLAQDAASGKTTRVYTQEHSSDLLQAAMAAETALKMAETGSARASQLRQLSVLAGEVSGDLAHLASSSSGDERMLADELEAAARACQAIGEALT